jgi:NADH dehydrogenase FAD-containing subunit
VTFPDGVPVLATYGGIVSATWTENPRHRVLIYGSGVAALEALLVLAEHARERCQVELVSPSRDFAVRAQAPELFGSRQGLRLDLGSLAAELGAGFRADAVTAIDAGRGEARTRLGQRLPYDSLIIACGTRLRETVPGAITAWGAADRTVFSRIVPELLSGDARSVAFCAHSGEPWTLRLYELALQTAARLTAAEVDQVELYVVTWEAAPGQVLGQNASDALAAVLEEEGIGVILGQEPARFEPGRLHTLDEAITADRAVALPRHDGCYIANVPLDEHGFIPVDELGRVEGVEGAHAAGDVTSLPIRHGSIAVEQGRAAAEAVAARAGAPIEPRPARPRLSGRLLASGVARRPGGSSGLWWPPEALSGPRLRRHLSESVGFDLPPVDGGIAVELTLEDLAAAVAEPAVEASSSPLV